MLTEYIIRPILKKKNQGKIQYRPSEISRLLSAAVINKGFRDLLLSDPVSYKIPPHHTGNLDAD